MQYYELLYDRPEEVLQRIVAHGPAFGEGEYRAALALIARSMRVVDDAALAANLVSLKQLLGQV